jgi:hypothetical protein
MSGLLGEEEEPMAVEGKMADGGVIDGGDYGDRFYFVDLIFVVLKFLAAATSSVHRVARTSGRRKEGER